MRRNLLAISLGVLWFLCIGTACTPRSDSDDTIEKLWNSRFLKEINTIIPIKTYRSGDTDEREVIRNLTEVKRKLLEWAEEFNRQLVHIKLNGFEWKKTIHGKDYWLFGLRLGSGSYKIVMITHLDTVPPGGDDWRPFEPRIEKRDYMGEKSMDFLVGRGAIDDKGPAVAAFVVLRSLAKKYDRTAGLDNVTVELIFDTSEETDMATPHYLKDPSVKKPDFGIVFDAMWCVRAEKGIERPVFSIARHNEKHGKLWIESLKSSPGPTNQIPTMAEAIIKASDPEALRDFYKRVVKDYEGYEFDDKKYRRAKLDPPILLGNTLKLITHVKGAQHGSAPQENRADGANPLVSLVNFLAYLAETGVLDTNAVSTMAKFVKSTWGTKVFGEPHPELLKAHDSVFQQGNGTTYAVTKFITEKKQVILKVDIRYAIGHHESPWDGKTEGLLIGKSRFEEIFAKLTRQFNRRHKIFPLEVETRNVFAPDIRLPTNPQFTRVNKAYKDVTGRDCNFVGIGGGTDAKGHPELIAVGALFFPRMGPPINFHGRNEGAPLEHLKTSALIMYNAMVNEIEHAKQTR